MPTKNSIKALNLPHGRIRGATWSNYPVEARCCSVLVGPTTWTWCKDLVGTFRRAIEVKLEAQTVYVDNENGAALQVFLKGHAPLPGFRFVPAYSVHDDNKAARSYQAEV